MSGGPASAATVASRLAVVRERLERACEACGRQTRELTIVAVTKGFDSEAIDAALTVGLNDIGENYYQEAAAKFAGVGWPPAARRHFIGTVQRNKARRIAALFDVVQTVDRIEIAQVLDRGAAQAGKRLDILIQLNVAADDRTGVAVEAAPQLARAIEHCTHLRLRGAMALGPANNAGAAPAFARAATAYRDLQSTFPDVDTLSLGMTGDLEQAVAAGSTMLRLGTALFGPRPLKEG